MSWSAIISAITGLVGLIRDFFLWKKSADDRKAGADAAINAGRAQEDQALKRTQAAMDEADRKPIKYRD
jgi:hypothetical protein